MMVRKWVRLEKWQKTMWVLGIGLFLCGASYTMVVPFLPLFLFDLGVPKDRLDGWSGVVYAAAFLVSALMAPIWGSLADRYGRRKMVIRAGISLAVVYSLTALVQSPWQLVAVRLLHGCVGGFTPASMAIVASTVPRERTGWSLGLMQAGSMAGTVCGPLLGGALSAIFGMRTSFLVSALLIFAATIAVWFGVMEESRPNANAAFRVIDDLKAAAHNRPLLLALGLMLVLHCSLNMMQPLLSLHIAHLQGKLEGVVLTSGFILFLIGIAEMIAPPWWGRAGERFGVERILTVCFLLSGSVAILQFTVHALWLFVAVQFLFGLFVAGIASSASIMIVRSSSTTFQGRAFGLTASADQLGAMFGALLGGMIGGLFQTQWIFLAAGVLLILSGLLLPKRTAQTKIAS